MCLPYDKTSLFSIDLHAHHHAWSDTNRCWTKSTCTPDYAWRKNGSTCPRGWRLQLARWRSRQRIHLESTSSTLRRSPVCILHLQGKFSMKLEKKNHQKDFFRTFSGFFSGYIFFHFYYAKKNLKKLILGFLPEKATKIARFFTFPKKIPNLYLFFFRKKIQIWRRIKTRKK